MKTSIVHAALFTPRSGSRWGLPLVLWGDPGIAKTSIIKMIAKQAGFHCEHLAPGERGEGAFGVTPVPAVGSNGTVLEYPPPDWVRKLVTADGTEAGIVFLDELNCLTGDTMVTTVDDNGRYLERQICDMLPGNRVVSFDLQSGQCCVNRVSHVQHMPAPAIVHIKLADGRDIRATPNHRFYVNGEWVFASELQPGIGLHLLSDTWETTGPHQIIEIISIETVAFDGEVWDLSVEVGHNFYANGILTHNTAPPALQPALLGAIQEGRIGGHEFGPRVRMIGAANPVGQAAGGWDLAPPVANRLGHIDWPAPEVDEWSTWLLAGEDHLETFSALVEEERVMKRWPLAFAKGAGLATAFLRRRPNLLHKMPGEGDPSSSRAWASPRSWEHAVRARAGAEVHGLTGIETDEFIAAFIGAAAAGEWGQWIDEADLPDPNDVLDGKVKYKHDPERLDRTMAVLAACAALITPAKAEKRKARSKAMWDLMSVIMEDAKDVVVPAMQAMVRAKLQRTAEARPVLAKMHSVVSAAGMTAGGQ